MKKTFNQTMPCAVRLAALLHRKPNGQAAGCQGEGDMVLIGCKNIFALAGIVSVGSTTVCLLHGGKKHIRHVGRQYPGRLQLLHRGKGGGSAGWS